MKDQNLKKFRKKQHLQIFIIFLTSLIISLISNTTYGQITEAGSLLYYTSNGKTYVLLAHHKMLSSDKDKPLEEKHGMRGWAGFGGTIISPESKEQTASRETEEESRNVYKNEDILNRIELLPSKDIIEYNGFALHLIKVEPISAKEINKNPIPEKEVYDERGPYVWITIDELVELLDTGENDTIKVDSTLFPTTTEAPWFYDKFVVTFKEALRRGDSKLFESLKKKSSLVADIKITNVKSNWFAKKKVSNLGWNPDLVHKNAKNHMGGAESYLNINFKKNGQPVLISESKLRKVSIISSKGDSIIREFDNWQYIKELNIRLRDFGNNVRHKDIITVQLEFEDGTTVYIPPGLTNNSGPKTIKKYFMYRNSSSLYPNGLWIPVGLFSTNFSGGDSGVTFAPLPIGIAFGTKKYLKRTYDKPEFYLGFSMVFNYMLFEGEMTEASSTQEDGFSVQTITTGLLIDINNYLYIGYVYGIDFRDNFNNPGSLFTFGIGPSLLNWAKGQK